jgi:hypothetical protein
MYRQISVAVANKKISVIMSSRIINCIVMTKPIPGSRIAGAPFSHAITALPRRKRTTTALNTTIIKTVLSRIFIANSYLSFKILFKLLIEFFP